MLRYGTARDMPAEELRLLVTSLAETVCAGLVHACRRLQTEEAEMLHGKLAALERAIALIESEPIARDWREALLRLTDDADGHALLRGFAVRALYDRGSIDAAEAGTRLSRALSPAVPPAEAGDWLNGFLGRAAQLLLHDPQLTGIIDEWMVALGEEDFVVHLPMLRRAFSSLDAGERRRLLDSLARSPATKAGAAGAPLRDAAAPDAGTPGFAAALPLLLTILGIDANAGEQRS